MAEERANGDDGTERDALEKLRELLVGPEQREIEDLRRRELTPEEVSRVLPKAVALTSRKDEKLASALGPTLEHAIEDAVRRNPRALAEAIAPVIGPAIRTAIRAALSGLVENVNRTLEHSFSPRGLRWRLEAWRTGRSFGEIVLRHSIVYRVEQVFLIHRETSLLLAHVNAPAVEVVDPDVVSSMLAAIQDFVADSFDERAPLAQVEFGEFVLEIAQGSAATLACVVRGDATAEQRERIRVVAEELHVDMANELRDFDGDAAAFAAAEPLLERCLGEQSSATSARTGRRTAWVALPLLALVVVVVLLAVRDHGRRGRWDEALDALRASAGVEVIDATRDGAGGAVLGLLDPLADDPAAALRAAGVDPEEVEVRWTPFVSLDPEIVLRRVRASLAPPDGIDVALDGGRLTLSGRASHAWLERSTVVATALPGVVLVDTVAVVDVDLEAALEAARRLELWAIVCTAERAEIEADGPELESLRAQLVALESAARRADLDVEVVVAAERAPGEDPSYASARADAVAAELIAISTGRAAIVTASVDTRDVAPRVGLSIHFGGADGTR